MARTVTYVNTDELREWARDTDWRDEKGREVADRGRVSTKLINDYNKANKRHFRQYSPISRNPQNYAPQPSPARDDTPPKASTSRATRSERRRDEDEDAVPAPRPQQPAARVEDSNGVNSLQDVIAMLQAAEKRGTKGGRPAVVTIQTLVNV